MDREDYKLIVIIGFARGGTGLLKNIITSHPNLLINGGEFSNVFYSRFKFNLPYRKHYIPRHLAVTRYLARWFITNPLHTNRIVSSFTFPYFHRIIFGPSESDVSENRNVLLTKTFSREISLVPFWTSLYRNCYFISLVRNGYAIAEGNARRGTSIKVMAQLYQYTVTRMFKLDETNRHMFVRFEDMVANPFKVADKIFAFTQLNPSKIDNLTLAKMPITQSDGSHVHQKDSNTVHRNRVSNFLEPTIDARQIERLSAADKALFDKYAGRAMARLGYS